ncbi:MAG: hypothetical protein ACP5HK_02620 [Acidilobus sp.]
MRIPLDRVCVKSGLLCPQCQAKVDSGLYERWEVDIMRALLDLERDFKELRNSSYKKSIRIGDVLYIVLDGVSSLSRDLGKALLSRLSSLNVKRIQVIAGPTDPRSLISSLVGVPVTLLNTYYAPDGSVYYVARLSQDLRTRVAGSEELIKKTFKVIVGGELVIEYEGAQGPSPHKSAPKVERVEKEKIEEWLKRLGR